MTENERYEVYTRIRGDQWTPKQITRHRKKVNQDRKRVAIAYGSTYYLTKRASGRKSGYTNYDFRNPS